MLHTIRSGARTSRCAPSIASLVVALVWGLPPALADGIELVGPCPTLADTCEALDAHEEHAAYLAAVRDRMSNPVTPVLCWPEDLPLQQRQTVMMDNAGLPPTLLRRFDTERYWVDSIVWTGDLSQGPSTRAQRARFTYSFPADGVTWGLADVSTTGPNTLNASLTSTFGATDIDEGREYFRQSLAAWRRYTGLTYQEVADDGSPMDQNISRIATRGDIRIGGRAFGTNTFLAYNAFPDPTFAGVGGGDMVMNTSFFIANNFLLASNNFRYLRNTVAHEHGHGIGAIHAVPCNGTKLMEPSISTAFDVVSIDDRRGGQRNYGDRFAGNNSAANAINFGDLTLPAVRSVIERDLSTNGSTGFNSTDQDWFRFTLSSTQNVVITATPTGGTYTAGQQSGGCSGTTGSINATSAGNLSIALYLADGTTTQQPIVNALGAGFAETLTANNLPAGTYFVRIRDVGPNASANQILQLYDLTLRVGTSNAPPLAIAGINKRVQANTRCFYMGDINSAATESGAFLSVFAWDLDGDGSFEISNDPKPIIEYPSNGVYNVTFRLTDNRGSVDTDTITTTVFGATTTVTACAPNNGLRGTTVPITISGTNLKNVTAAHVSVTGSGVSVTGTAVPNSLGTSVTGLSLVISSGAATGPRSITVSNADGSGTGTGLFTVNSPTPPGSFALSAPSNGSTNVSLTPSFSWAASVGASTYTLSIANNGALTSPIFTQSGIAGTSFNLPSGVLAQNTQYWWGVSAVGPGGATNSSPIAWVFTTLPPPPPTSFTLNSPANAATGVSLTPTFSWSASAGVSTYTLIVANNSALTSPLFTQAGIGGTSFALPPGTLANGATYWWGVVAVGPGGNTSSSPASRSFTTVPPNPPGAFSLLTPASGEVNVPLTPTFTWSAATNTTTYTLTLADNSALTTPLFSQSGIAATTFNLPSGILAEGVVYWWGVTAVGPGGNTGSTPASRSFTTVPPAPACPGDTNGDNAIDSADLSIVLGNFGQPASGVNAGDFNADNFCDIADLSILLGSFGAVCN